MRPLVYSTAGLLAAYTAAASLFFHDQDRPLTDAFADPVPTPTAAPRSTPTPTSVSCATYDRAARALYRRSEDEYAASFADNGPKGDAELHQAELWAAGAAALAKHGCRR